MELLQILIGIFTLANTFIALFIVVYAFLFLKKTKSHKDRRPWDYLFLASMIYLLYTLFLMILNIYGIDYVFTEFGIYEMSVLFQFIYTGLILLSFISQTDLIFNNEIIIIMKKENDVPNKTQLPENVIKSDVNNEKTQLQIIESKPELNKLEEKVSGKQLDEIETVGNDKPTDGVKIGDSLKSKKTTKKLMVKKNSKTKSGKKRK